MVMLTVQWWNHVRPADRVRCWLVPCRKLKTGQQKVQLDYEDEPLCASGFIIYLWLDPFFPSLYYIFKSMRSHAADKSYVGEGGRILPPQHMNYSTLLLYLHTSQISPTKKHLPPRTLLSQYVCKYTPSTLYIYTLYIMYISLMEGWQPTFLYQQKSSK